MLHQVEVSLLPQNLDALNSSLSVKLHGLIMSLIDTDYAAELHKCKLPPFSQYTVIGKDAIIWRVSALTDDAACIIERVSALSSVRVFGLDKPLKVISVKQLSPLDAASLGCSANADRCTLNFLSPAAYKANWKYSNQPSLTRLFSTVGEKLCHFEQESAARADIIAALESIEIKSYRYMSENYRVNGGLIPGMVGSVDLLLSGSAEEKALAKRLLAYARYSGVGAKTAMGMGGVALTGV